MRLLHAARTRLRLLFARGPAESRMRDEFAFHIEMEAARLARAEGLSPAEARRRALVAFGGVERYGEELREGRGGAWLGSLELDLRLGLRMLVKYPGLALVGGLGMAVAIAIATASFGMIYSMLDPALPVPEGDRVVMVQHYDTRLSNPNRATHVHAMEVWREELTTVVQLGGFRTVPRNLHEGDDVAELVRVAEMSASGFIVTRVPPLLGRPLLASDEQPGAPGVVVIGEAVWRNRFGGDPHIIGRGIRLGSVEHTIVGVMPASYGFPVNHQYWTPLRLDADDYAHGAGPSLTVFGRLANGATLAAARAQVETLGRRLLAADPDVYRTIQPQVMPYTHPFFDIDKPSVAWAMHLIQFLITLLLVVVGVNVAILMYARTTTRLGEITVRTALGASRRRIVLQLFAEALVLSGIAAGAGLALGAFVLDWMGGMMRSEFGGELPFWLDPGVTPGLVAYVAGLAVLAALIVGAAPALKATGRRIQSGLKNLGTGTSGGQLGRTWTVLVVAQVALAVALLPAAVQSALQAARYATADPGYPSGQYLRAGLSMERQVAPPTAAVERYERAFARRFADATLQLLRRLEADPAVADATFARSAPGGERVISIEVAAGGDGDGEGEGADAALHRAAYNVVAPDFLDAFDAPVLAGRGFTADDASDASGAMIVSRSFARRALGGTDVLGRQLRYTAPAHESDPDLAEDLHFEVVGVVRDFPVDDMQDEPYPRVYRALAPGALDRVTLLVRTHDRDATGYIRQLRALATSTSAELELDEPIAIDDAARHERSIMRMLALGVLLGTLSVVLLSAGGIYAMTSFAVARRAREIGIRAALGAAPTQLLRAMFARVAVQLGAGIALGLALAAVLDRGIEGEYAALLPAVAALMLLVGMLAAAGPARRGLRIQPTEALREE